MASTTTGHGHGRRRQPSLSRRDAIENAQFFLFLCAVIKAVDDYQDLLRISVATAGNDHRLGANIMLNSAVAESLKQFADELEGAEQFENALHALIKRSVKEHKRILFNGNGYDDAWIREATEKRGLSNFRTTPDCMPHLLDEKNVRMLTALKVFTEAELRSRVDIMLENYCKTVVIEANTMSDMAKRQILPAVEAYARSPAETAAAKKAALPDASCGYEKSLIGYAACS